MLRDSAAETRARGCPDLRLERDLPATLRWEGKTRLARVRELTQQGMKVTHDGDVYPSAADGDLGADKARHGIVR